MSLQSSTDPSMIEIDSRKHPHGIRRAQCQYPAQPTRTLAPERCETQPNHSPRQHSKCWTTRTPSKNCRGTGYPVSGTGRLILTLEPIN